MPVDPQDTQPNAGAPARKHRKYIPAVWKPLGMGGGAPKISGGYEVDQHGDPIPTRGFNRPDQRYTQPPTTLQATRTTRALAEHAATVVLQGAGGIIEVRSPSGNNYDVAHDVSVCQCPDHFRLKASYPSEDIQCKHRLIATMAMGAGGYNTLPWSVARLAECIGESERAAAQQCQKGECPATQIHRVWVIQVADGQAFCTWYRANKLIPPR